MKQKVTKTTNPLFPYNVGIDLNHVIWRLLRGNTDRRRGRKRNILLTCEIAKNYRILHRVTQHLSQHNLKFRVIAIFKTFTKNNVSNKTCRCVHEETPLVQMQRFNIEPPSTFVIFAFSRSFVLKIFARILNAMVSRWLVKFLYASQKFQHPQILAKL
jgi:hypothetical protein